MDDENKLDNNKPPILGSWKNFYALVLGVLVFLILIFYGITQYYA